MNPCHAHGYNTTVVDSPFDTNQIPTDKINALDLANPQQRDAVVSVT
jgi:hypothetical protein